MAVMTRSEPDGGVSGSGVRTRARSAGTVILRSRRVSRDDMDGNVAGASSAASSSKLAGRTREPSNAARSARAGRLRGLRCDQVGLGPTVASTRSPSIVRACRSPIRRGLLPRVLSPASAQSSTIPAVTSWLCCVLDDYDALRFDSIRATAWHGCRRPSTLVAVRRLRRPPRPAVTVAMRVKNLRDTLGRDDDDAFLLHGGGGRRGPRVSTRGMVAPTDPRCAPAVDAGHLSS